MKKNSLSPGLIGIVILLAIIVYVVENAPFLIFIVVIVVVIILLCIKQGNAEQLYTKQNNNSKYDKQEDLLERIDNMGGQEFEKFLVEKILPIDGYTDLSLTSSTNDYGVDIIAFKDNIKCAIQCKRANNKVSNRAIQEIVAGRKHYKCDKAIVITNNYYTENANRLAFDS